MGKYIRPSLLVARGTGLKNDLRESSTLEDNSANGRCADPAQLSITFNSEPSSLGRAQMSLGHFVSQFDLYVICCLPAILRSTTSTAGVACLKFAPCWLGLFAELRKLLRKRV